MSEVITAKTTNLSINSEEKPPKSIVHANGTGFINGQNEKSSNPWKSNAVNASPPEKPRLEHDWPPITDKINDESTSNALPKYSVIDDKKKGKPKWKTLPVQPSNRPGTTQATSKPAFVPVRPRRGNASNRPAPHRAPNGFNRSTSGRQGWLRSYSKEENSSIHVDICKVGESNDDTEGFSVKSNSPPFENDSRHIGDADSANNTTSRSLTDTKSEQSLSISRNSVKDRSYGSKGYRKNPDENTQSIKSSDTPLISFTSPSIYPGATGVAVANTAQIGIFNDPSALLMSPNSPALALVPTATPITDVPTSFPQTIPTGTQVAIAPAPVQAPSYSSGEVVDMTQMIASIEEVGWDCVQLPPSLQNHQAIIDAQNKAGFTPSVQTSESNSEILDANKDACPVDDLLLFNRLRAVNTNETELLQAAANCSAVEVSKITIEVSGLQKVKTCLIPQKRSIDASHSDAVVPSEVIPMIPGTTGLVHQPIYLTTSQHAIFDSSIHTSSDQPSQIIQTYNTPVSKISENNDTSETVPIASCAVNTAATYTATQVPNISPPVFLGYQLVPQQNSAIQAYLTAGNVMPSTAVIVTSAASSQAHTTPSTSQVQTTSSTHASSSNNQQNGISNLAQQNQHSAAAMLPMVQTGLSNINHFNNLVLNQSAVNQNALHQFGLVPQQFIHPMIPGQTMPFTTLGAYPPASWIRFPSHSQIGHIHPGIIPQLQMPQLWASAHPGAIYPGVSSAQLYHNAESQPYLIRNATGINHLIPQSQFHSIIPGHIGAMNSAQGFYPSISPSVMIPTAPGHLPHIPRFVASTSHIQQNQNTINTQSPSNEPSNVTNPQETAPALK